MVTVSAIGNIFYQIRPEVKKIARSRSTTKKNIDLRRYQRDDKVANDKDQTIIWWSDRRPGFSEALSQQKIFVDSILGWT